MTAFIVLALLVGCCLTVAGIQKRWQGLQKLARGLLVTYVTVVLLAVAGEEGRVDADDQREGQKQHKPESSGDLAKEQGRPQSAGEDHHQKEAGRQRRNLHLDQQVGQLGQLKGAQRDRGPPGCVKRDESRRQHADFGPPDSRPWNGQCQQGGERVIGEFPSEGAERGDQCQQRTARQQERQLG